VIGRMRLLTRKGAIESMNSVVSVEVIKLSLVLLSRFSDTATFTARLSELSGMIFFEGIFKV
jgi:hypothetical protein